MPILPVQNSVPKVNEAAVKVKTSKGNRPAGH